MVDFLKRIAKEWKSGTEYLNYGREIIQKWAVDYILEQYNKNSKTGFKILDQGCGHGDDLLNIKESITNLNLTIRLELIGIENYLPYVEECRQKGIKIFSIDIEKDVYPVKDNEIDIIISNQVLEHTKEIFWIFEQFQRILKPGGILIIGVPNLASLHNRVLLFLGEQPTSQQSLSPHIRTFTLPDLKKFAEVNDFFKFLEKKGSNFYPFPPSLSKFLSKMFPSLSWGLFVKFVRTEKRGSFLQFLYENLLETPFYGSPQNPAKYKNNQRYDKGKNYSKKKRS